MRSVILTILKSLATIKRQLYNVGIKVINFALQLDPKNKTSLNIRSLLVQEIRGTH